MSARAGARGRARGLRSTDAGALAALGHRMARSRPRSRSSASAPGRCSRARTGSTGDGVRHGTRSHRRRHRDGAASPATDRRTAAGATAPRLDQLLVRHGNDTTTEAALGKLFAPGAQPTSPRDGGKVATRPRSQGLECLFQKGSWAQLRTLNRPAILDADRRHRSHPPGAADGARPTRPPPSTWAAHRASVSDRRDVALLVRRFPAAVASTARRGEGARARHARRRRALAAREPARRAGPAGRAGAAATSTTRTSTRLVQDFQRQHRLNVDGVAGVQTQIVLDTVVNATGSPTRSWRSSAGG